MFRIVLAGSVKSSFLTLQSLVAHNLEVVGVLGYEPLNSNKVSGYVKMDDFCTENKIPYHPFIKINDEKNIEFIKSLEPDIFFVIGLSQLVSNEMLSISKLGNIGFHPTLLPRGRGRGPIAWLILEEKYGAANFFLMGEGADDGPVFIQEPFEVTDLDNATSVEEKILNSITSALNKWLPDLKKGVWNCVPQQDLLATYFAKRSPEDGLIDWHLSSKKINKLVRASSNPHPGAYTFYKNNKIIIWSSQKSEDIKIKGVTGSVLLVRGEKCLIQCGHEHLWIWDITNEIGEPVSLKVGQKLGYYIEDEIYKLKKEIQSIRQWIQEKTL